VARSLAFHTLCKWSGKVITRKRTYGIVINYPGSANPSHIKLILYAE
jgi:hypothetical protein